MLNLTEEYALITNTSLQTVSICMTYCYVFIFLNDVSVLPILKFH